MNNVNRSNVGNSHLADNPNKIMSEKYKQGTIRKRMKGIVSHRYRFRDHKGLSVVQLHDSSLFTLTFGLNSLCQEFTSRKTV